MKTQLLLPLVIFVSVILFSVGTVSANTNNVIIYALGDELFLKGNDAPIQIAFSDVSKMSDYQITKLKLEANNKSYNGTIWVFSDTGIISASSAGRWVTRKLPSLRR